MALKSRFFRGDPKLEAAAVSDPAHIAPGAAGQHVSKIQQALIELDGANIDPDSKYGPATAAAVLAYKKKRNIINRSYQTQADNIVGKMTMATLDSEMLRKEAGPVGPPRIEAMFPGPRPVFRDPALAARPAVPRLAFKFGANLEPDRTPEIIIPPSPTFSMQIPVHGIGGFRVVNGAGGLVRCEDPLVGQLFDPGEQKAHGGTMRVTKDPHFFNVRGLNPGSTFIKATNTPKSGAERFALGALVSLVVDAPRSNTVFHLGVNHGHKPSGRWADVQKDPGNREMWPTLTGLYLDRLCRGKTPREFVEVVIAKAFGGKLRALAHLRWYLTAGGRDFPEDQNIRDWLRADEKIQEAIRLDIRDNFLERGMNTGKHASHFTFESPQFAEQHGDFHWSFGAIDRVDYEVDFGAGTVHVWVQDRYEWHPNYPFYFPQGDDVSRPTNCLHAALVELKSEGAADFWMKGEATVPLKLIFPK